MNGDTTRLRREAAELNKGFDQMVGHVPNDSKCPPTDQSRRWPDWTAAAHEGGLLWV